MDKPEHLNTTLVDYLLQRSLPPELSSDILVGSSASLNYLKNFCSKLNSKKKTDLKSVEVIKKQYQYYATSRFEFIGVNCGNNHFFVIHVGFDARSPLIFDRVDVYDSLRRTGRTADNVNANSVGAQYLKTFQLFLAKFVFNGMPSAETLANEPNYILNYAQFKPCPQQENGSDCALFAFATALHLCFGISVNRDTFTQDQITHFRGALHYVCDNSVNENMPDPTKKLSQAFIIDYFHKLRDTKASEEDEFLTWIYESTSEIFVENDSSTTETIETIKEEEMMLMTHFIHLQ